jgi:uncharacterized protein (DUF2236 family)
MYGKPDDAAAEAMYQEAARLGTTLQVPADMWPADQAAFADYWKVGVGKIAIDDRVRKHLRGVAAGDAVGWPLNALFRPVNMFFCTGFLPPEFREQMRLEWNPRKQRRFDRLMRIFAFTDQYLPEKLRRFPFNYMLWDVRRRIAAGRPLV